MSARWVTRVLDFWFEELGRPDWFGKGKPIDGEIAARFQSTYDEISASAAPASLGADADTALAAVLVLDQFPRNIFRGTPGAFATDASARAVAEAAIGAGFDSALPLDRRLFLYLPFEHSEDVADQERAVKLISSLGDAEYTAYAEAHANVIRRFGRFPHRNAILGRLSTPEELTYLAEPGSGF
jgi:uncharacterized protein (DUF924 family)